jgi:predicted dehydrogenase
LPTDNGQVNEILHFADCCRQGTEPVSSGSDNLKTMSVVFAIYEAARRGARVELADLSPVLPT